MLQDSIALSNENAKKNPDFDSNMIKYMFENISSMFRAFC